MSRKKTILLYSIFEFIILIALVVCFVTLGVQQKVFLAFMIIIAMLSSLLLMYFIKKSDPDK